MSETIWASGKPAEVTLSNEIYWASRPPEVRRLRTLVNEECFAEAQRLADAGHTIDVPIDVWHWGADMTMYARLMYGYTWVPAAHQAPIVLGPGITGLSGPQYDPDHPPEGSIKVSVKAEDYPPFDKPVATTAPGEQEFVGKHLYANVFTYGPASVKDGKFTVANGDERSQGGKRFKARMTFGLFGPALEYVLLGEV